MTIDIAGRRVLAVSVVAATILAAGAASLGSNSAEGPSGSGERMTAQRVVVFTMPGITWADIAEADTPVLDELVEQGATAALAPRSASVRPSSVRGYLSLGAGNRGAAAHDGDIAQRAHVASETINGDVTAAMFFASLVGSHREGRILHVGVPELSVDQRSQYHGTEVGALGEALARARIPRAIVSAADRTADGRPSVNNRGAPVLAVVDRSGVVPDGTIRALVEPSAPGPNPYGVRTSPRLFDRALQRALRTARFVLVEPGETLRADDLSHEALPHIAMTHRKRALERTDRLLRVVVEALDRDDLLLVVAPSSASNDPQEHLTPVVAWGTGVDPGMLVSATTRRAGVVTLTDVAPTVLDAFGVERPQAMSGRAMRAVATTTGPRPDVHDELDARSVFRERFVHSVFYGFVALFVILSFLVGLVFLGRLPLRTPLVAVCYLILSVPLATFVFSVLPLWHRGTGVAHVALWSIAIVIAGVGWIVPGPRWAGAIPILVATVVFVAVDLFTGGHLLVNAVFGNSVLAAGRFYGIPNTGSALFFGAGVLALSGIGEIWERLGTRLWLAGGLVVLLMLTGLPPYGADVGGLLTGVAAACVILLIAGRARVPWRLVAFALLVAVVATLGVAYLDSLRPEVSQTHLGRFGEALFGGDRAALQVIMRKAKQSWASLSFSRFTWVIPLGIAALAVLLRRPTGPLRDVLPSYPLFTASLAGLLVAGVLGFALNDSGVAVPAMLLAQAVPLVVLLGADHFRARGTGDD